MELVKMRNTPAKTRLAANDNMYQQTSAVSKTAAYTMTPADAGKLFNHTGATGSVTFTFPASLPVGWWVDVLHDENQTIVLSGSSATINGAATKTSDNTQDPTAFARIIKTSSGNFTAFLLGTWT